MEKRLNDKSKIYVSAFKDAVRNKAVELGFHEEPEKINELLEFVNEYDRLCFEKDDFIKRKRIKNAIPQMNRCNAKRANGDQCTRKRRDDCEFCGTHYKGTPHGLITENEEMGQDQNNQKMEVFVEEIGGIVYYIDRYKNVYKTEDILQAKDNPKIIAQYEKLGDKYTIPEFGLV
jgi:hypothetical protein